MLTRSDYEDWWKTPDLAIEEYIDDYPALPLAVRPDVIVFRTTRSRTASRSPAS